jgi:RNA polymerase sigma-70 factor (ECF subfamily)
MDDRSDQFETHRAHLVGLAYRMLGSVAEAEDAVQDAYLRWHGADRGNVANPRASDARSMSGPGCRSRLFRMQTL